MANFTNHDLILQPYSGLLSAGLLLTGSITGTIDRVRFRIQHLQWLGGIVAAAACVALGGLSLQTNFADHARYQRGAEQLARFHSVLVAAHAISAERGPANGAMGGAEEKRTILAAALAAKRAETDSRIAELEARFASERGRFADIDALQSEMRSRLEAGRRAVDEVVARSPAERSGTPIRTAIEAMLAAADASATLRDRLGREIVAGTPQVATHVLLNSIAGNLREETGRLGSYVVMQLSADPDQRRRLEVQFVSTRARLELMWRALASYAGAVLPDIGVDEAITAVERDYFATALPYAESVVRDTSLGTAPDADAFTRAYVPGMRPVELLRERIAATSRATMEALRHQALLLALASLLLTGVAIVAIVVIALIFRDGLFHPLLNAHRQIVQIARGDLSDPPPIRNISAEVRTMFASLDLLREQQRQRLQLEEDQRLMSEALRHLSETDMLTGLLNRRALTEAAERALYESDRHGAPVSAVLFDIDHFKAINDGHGHAVGDLVLKTIAHDLRAVAGADVAFARHGGEEFLLMLPDTPKGAAIAVAERLRRAIEAMTLDTLPGLRVTSSFGVACRTAGAMMSWEELVATADRRLYRAKQAGRNRVCGSDDQPAAPRSAAAAAETTWFPQAAKAGR